MNLAIVYTSKTGHTEELAYWMKDLFFKKRMDVQLFRIEQFPLDALTTFDGVIIGTYTWGNGEIPVQMLSLYRRFEIEDVKHTVTGVFGTGDSCYPQFCGAVNTFRDMLYVHSRLAATMKVEVAMQTTDLERCMKFVDIFEKRMKTGP